ncbi:RNA 3'-terminal phosphate cyclase-like protein [Capsaspora owczarzaki ATCC 30864]|uniref:RNA 3'-terminal phosphate cyclase-like protein n=1 Tax=Capsaspora owczarzaki (strain ATCC 30864) TaxID=595528 RepID=A0A0D2WLP9_CAPO3|nr:RNA 3'-terminal phosphate cyclase-like protein [Capsaspora owczarzaki ATCC 30864]
MAEPLRYSGAAYFRQRIVLSVLSGRPVRIDNIRSTEDSPGLSEYEANFLKLIDKLTNGSQTDINYTGTAVLFKPGFFAGGQVEHDCGTERAVGYYLEPVISMAPFGKAPLSLTLTGITNSAQDPSVDVLRTVTLPTLKLFGLEDGAELRIARRGAPPLGGGQVFFSCPVVKQLKPVQLLEAGKIKRIRGIAYSTRVSPQTANRIVDAARSLLNTFIPDVYIYTDHYKGAESGRSPGFALSLVAESTTGVLTSAECAAEAGMLPEDLGLRTAKLLFEEISRLTSHRYTNVASNS